MRINRRTLDRHTRHRRRLRPAGRCRGCGCMDDHACAGGCYWVTKKHDLCNRCRDREAREAREAYARRSNTQGGS